MEEGARHRAEEHLHVIQLGGETEPGPSVSSLWQVKECVCVSAFPLRALWMGENPSVL